jgi:hypothetical protein
MVLMTIERYLIIKNPLISLDLNTRLIISMFIFMLDLYLLVIIRVYIVGLSR